MYSTWALLWSEQYPLKVVEREKAMKLRYIKTRRNHIAKSHCDAAANKLSALLKSYYFDVSQSQAIQTGITSFSSLSIIPASSPPFLSHLGLCIWLQFSLSHRIAWWLCLIVKAVWHRPGSSPCHAIRDSITDKVPIVIGQLSVDMDQPPDRWSPCDH